MQRPLVSIVIPIYKVEKFIERCLKSVLEQTYTNIECIVIDDCSPDKSMEIASQFINDHPDFNFKIVHHSTNLGLSEARNSGMRTAMGKYIYFFDSDDAITPTAIEKLVDKAELSQAEMTIGLTSCINEKEEWVRDYFPITHSSDEISGNQNIFTAFIEDLYPGMACNKLVKLDFLLNNNLFFEKGLLSQDVLWGFQSAFYFTKIAFVREITYLYYFHEDSIIHNRGEKHFNDWIKIINFFNESYISEKDKLNRKLIKKYIVRFKTLTLQLNWKAQKSELLWKKSYDQYKKVVSLSFIDYFDSFFLPKEKKENFFHNLPTNLGFKIFTKRYQGNFLPFLSKLIYKFK